MAATTDAAMLALESRVRDNITARLSTLQQRIAAQAILTADDPKHSTGNEVVSAEAFHTTVTEELAEAQADVSNTTRGAYVAAAILALAVLRTDMHDIGHNVAGTMPDLGPALKTLIADIGVAFAAALVDTQRKVQAGFDTDADRDKRVIAVNDAVRQSIGRLRRRTVASAVVAVHRAATDTRQAVYADYTRTNPGLPLRKRWQVTAVDPCPICAALDGVTVPVAAQFPYGDDLPVWLNLYGPPRHPNCRCTIEHTFDE